MRSLRVNRRTFWYAVYTGHTALTDSEGRPTGEKVPEYGEPKKFRANVSAANGEYAANAPGMNMDYERSIYTHRTDLPITEDSLIWFDRSPEEGLPANYVVTRVVDGLHGTFYELRRVDRR